jgi:ABC-type transport system involved in multi-copper enzyme maturation permease subunit
MLLGALAFTAVAVVAQMATAGIEDSGQLPLDTAQTQHSIFSSAGSSGIFALIVGIIMITTEYRHFTSRPTFLFEPRRGRVIIAKIGMSAAVGLLYALACVILTFAIAVPWFAAKDVAIEWSAYDIPMITVGVVLSVTIYAVVGLGVGVLVHNQIAAVIGALAYLLILEPLIGVIPVIKEAYRFLPGAAANAIAQVNAEPDLLLTRWQGVVVLLGWGLLFAFLGWLISMRRDVQ